MIKLQIEKVTLDQQARRLESYFHYTSAWHVVLVGLDLGLFQALFTLGRPVSSDELAAKRKLNKAYIGVWCRTAYALGLLDIDERGAYHLAPHIDKFLGDTDSPFYLGKMSHFLSDLIKSYQHYPKLFKSTRTVRYAKDSEALSRTIAESTKIIPPFVVQQILPEYSATDAKLLKGGRALDIGCGEALALITICQRYPRGRAEGIDIDKSAIKRGLARIKREKLVKKITLQAVSAAKFRPKHKYDLILSILTFQYLSDSERNTILSLAHRSLEDEGMLMIVEDNYPSDPAELQHPDYLPAVIAQWYKLGLGSRMLSYQALADLLSKHHFKDIKYTRLLNNKLMVVTARKAT
jgi:SAM-dependent methyltransferase